MSGPPRILVTRPHPLRSPISSFSVLRPFPLLHQSLPQQQQQQRRPFLSRLLRKATSRDPLKVDLKSPAFRAKVEAEKNRDKKKVHAPRTRGALGPNSLLLRQPMEPDPAADAPPGSRKQKFLALLRDLKDDEVEKGQVWESLHPTERTFLVTEARRLGWSPPPSSTTSSSAAIPPLPLLKSRLKFRDSLLPLQSANLTSQTRRHLLRHSRIKGGALIKKSERSVELRSPLIKTSRKKLSPLARQIAGKKLGDAMVQMRFSKKRAAVEVLKHLAYVRDKANLEGMGLGLEAKNVEDAREFHGPEDDAAIEGKEPRGQKAQAEREGEDAAAAEEADGDGAGTEVAAPTYSAPTPASQPETVVVRDRKGNRQVISDRSELYIDQAWVGHGKWEFGLDHRARGQIHRLYKPYTSITVLLKEERTRLREAEARAARKKKKKDVWVQLPDRPVTAQRQYPLW